MTSAPVASAEDVLTYWFDVPPRTEDEVMTHVQRWFRGGSDVDAEIRQRFQATVEASLRGELDHWAINPKGRLALVLVLDQFTRNVFRGDPRTYSGDSKAQQLALEAFDAHLDEQLEYVENVFLSMPLLHSETHEHHLKLAAFQQRNVPRMSPFYARFNQMNLEQAAKYEDIIRRFGRFPHRNEILGRPSTPEEVLFLQDWAKKMSPSGMQPKSQ